jgi:medium-chain acyl-[acyl-carrier-protein] hydrolase
LPGGWVIRPRPRPHATMRLLCVPWAGGGASSYSPWADLLPDHVELCAIQLPGRENRLRDTPYVRLSDLIHELSGAIAPEISTAYALFGYSLGGLIAFELARHLTDMGKSPAHLFVAACGSPDFRRLRPPMHRMSDDALLAALRRYDGLPDWVMTEPELLRLVLPTLRADLEMFETYEYARSLPLPCAITAFGGMSDRSVLPMEIAGWERQTSVRFDMRLFSGHHFFIGPHRIPLLQTIVATLGATSS